MTNPFSKKRYDLGISDTIGSSKSDIDSLFSNPEVVSRPCLYCGNPAIFRIIPKKDSLNTAEIQDKGFMCEYCTKQGYLNSELYGIRPLK